MNPVNPKIINGQQIKQATIDGLFLSSPGEDIVPKTLLQLSSIPGFVALFGPYISDSSGNKTSNQQRWADYQRMDWSVRQLPAINVFEASSENKDSDQAFLRGTVQIQVFWPPNMRREDLARVPAAFKGVLENFFSSDYVGNMLDELYYIQRPMKVYGLNEYGKTLTWSPNVEGIVEDELVPVTILDVQYRIDLRSWYRALEFMRRTKGQPFEVTLEPLVEILGEYDGLDQDEVSQIVVADDFTVNT
jgi:hypothetical protein